MSFEVVAFVTVTIGLLAACWLVGRFLKRDAARVHRRIAEEFGTDQNAVRQQSLFKNVDKIDLSSEQPDTVNPRIRLQVGQLRAHLLESLAVWLEQSRVPLRAGQYLLVCVVLGCLAGLAGTVLGRVWVGALAGALAASSPAAYVYHKRKARYSKFQQQLPNAFELMARMIRGGQSVPQALTCVAETFDNPIAQEFTHCLQQQNFGLRPEVAFQEMALRWGITELRIFVMAMLIQRQTGGNLSEVLERLASLVRSRQRLRKHVRTLTAEGRLQGLTLCVLPFLMLGVLMFINRGYVQVLFQHVPLLAGTGALMVVGLVWIRRIVNFEI